MPDTHDAPLFSILIPTLQEGDYLDATLACLAALALPHEVIVSDGGSTDATLEIARRHGARIVEWEGDRRQTFGEAKNAAAAMARGQYLVFIDADVVIPGPTAFFEELLGLFARKPKLAGVTVPLLPRADYARLGDRFFSAPLNFWYVVSNNLFHYGNASGEFQMFPRALFEKVGGYREDLPGGEDTDMFNRVSRVGRTLSYWHLAVRHTCRRAHKTGWLRLYGIWMLQGFHVLIFRVAYYAEWKVVR